MFQIHASEFKAAKMQGTRINCEGRQAWKNSGWTRCIGRNIAQVGTKMAEVMWQKAI